MSCVTESHSDGWRWSRISTKMHCDFHQNLVFEASSVSARLWDAPAGSRITAGSFLTFEDGVTIDTGRPPSTAAISTPFLNGSSANPLLYSTVVTKNEVQARTEPRSTKKSSPTSLGPKIMIFSFLQKHSSSLLFFWFCVRI